MTDSVRLEIVDRVAVVTIDNPPVNALSAAVWDGIGDAVARAAADLSVDAVVLIGAGANFIAVDDINIFETLKTPRDAMDRSARTHALLGGLEGTPKPLVAAIHGNALGGRRTAENCREGLRGTVWQIEAVNAGKRSLAGREMCSRISGSPMLPNAKPNCAWPTR